MSFSGTSEPAVFKIKKRLLDFLQQPLLRREEEDISNFNNGNTQAYTGHLLERRYSRPVPGLTE